MAMNREQKRMMQRQGQVDAEGAPVAQRRQPQPQKQQKEARATPPQFLREVRAELRKVVWPTRAEVINYSIITLVAIVVMTTLVALIDWGFGEGILWVIDR